MLFYSAYSVYETWRLCIEQLFTIQGEIYLGHCSRQTVASGARGRLVLN